MSSAAEAEDLLESEFGLKGIELSAYRYPTGWFPIGWSMDIGIGEVKPLHYFGQELVMFRTESGRLVVLDAYCKHLGAHLGHGGKVVGECLQCPWHGWQWTTEGTNSLIPYSRIGSKRGVRIRNWETREWYGYILVWHDRHGRAPYWGPPRVPEFDERQQDFYPPVPHSRMVNRIKVHPQMIVENAADPYHVQYTHKAYRAATTSSFSVRKHHLHATVSANFGGGREKTWLTPNGPVDCEVVYDTYGIGLGFVRFPPQLLESILITGHTPVDEQYTDYFFIMALRREPGDLGDIPSSRAERFMRVQQETIKQDFKPWEHMQYLAKPSLAPEEAKDYAALRRWAHRFYPGPEPGANDFGYSPDGSPIFIAEERPAG
jgi:phenylpropionate dioxygenase-like ring-hydroxylating dioxygenase large terminal subunit